MLVVGLLGKVAATHIALRTSACHDLKCDTPDSLEHLERIALLLSHAIHRIAAATPCSPGSTQRHVARGLRLLSIAN